MTGFDGDGGKAGALSAAADFTLAICAFNDSARSSFCYQLIFKSGYIFARKLVKQVGDATRGRAYVRPWGRVSDPSTFPLSLWERGKG